MRNFVLAVAGLIWLAACSSTPQVGGSPNSPFPFVLAGVSQYAALSGRPATALILEPGNEDMAVERLGWRRNGPDSCFVEFFKRAPNTPTQQDKDVSEKCDQNMPHSRYLTAGFDNAASSGSLTFVTAIRTCFEKKSGRLAGYELVLKRFSLDGTSAMRSDLPAEQYTANMQDCELAPWSECPEGQVVNGVRTHYGRIKKHSNIIGIEARCRALQGPKR